MTGARGRPLRFLALVTSGWIGLRVAMLWPQIDTPEDVLRAIAPIPLAEADAPHRPVVPTPAPAAQVSPRWRVAIARTAAAPRRRYRSADPTRVALALLGLVRYGDAQPVEPDAPLLPGLPRRSPPPPPPHVPSRWSASLWLVARGGSGLAPGTLGGQLGGSQAGVRVAYLLDRRHRVALAGRVTTPLGNGLREAALGVEWQPTRLPVRLLVEHRFALNGGRGGPAAGVVGGVGPVVLPAGFRLEAYGQAGVIRRVATEAYVDGAMRVAHPLTTVGPLRLDLGAGAWGAAQRGAARLDVGPSLGVVVPLGKQPVRLSLDWRQRVAGDARPGSGLALTLGADF